VLLFQFRLRRQPRPTRFPYTTLFRSATEEDEETLGDRVRTVLGDDAEMIETVEVLGRTAHEELPEAARSRLRTQPGQANLLLRIILRPIDQTRTADQANAIRNTIYRALHDGPVMELI